jgi:hypothetical protein
MSECSCCDDSNLGDEVIVKKPLYRAMMVALAEKISANQSIPLDFTPNPNFGEGIATQKELDNRQELLRLLEGFKDYLDQLLNSNLSVDEKKVILDNASQTMISEGQKMVERQIREVYNQRKEDVGLVLKQMGLSFDEGQEDEKRLNILIEQQKDNIEMWIITIRNKVRQELNINRVFGFYGI